MKDVIRESENDLTRQYKIFGEGLDFGKFALSRAARLYIQTTRSDNLVTVEFSEKAKPREIDKYLANFEQTFASGIYAAKDASLEEIAVETLSAKGKTLSVAESLTGGLIAAKIVNVSGASEVFYEGVVTYSNDSKIRRLNVSEDALRSHGAVSEEISRAMCRGLFESGGCGYALSTTGIAGPGGATLTKPVGLCYISVGDKENTVTQKFVFVGDRNTVRLAAAETALFMFIKFAKPR